MEEGCNLFKLMVVLRLDFLIKHILARIKVHLDFNTFIPSFLNFINLDLLTIREKILNKF